MTNRQVDKEETLARDSNVRKIEDEESSCSLHPTLPRESVCSNFSFLGSHNHRYVPLCQSAPWGPLLILAYGWATMGQRLRRGRWWTVRGWKICCWPHAAGRRGRCSHSRWAFHAERQRNRECGWPPRWSGCLTAGGELGHHRGGSHSLERPSPRREPTGTGRSVL